MPIPCEKHHPAQPLEGARWSKRFNSPFSQLTMASALHISTIFGYVVKKILLSWVKLVTSHYTLQKANSLCRQKSSLVPEMPTLLVVSNSVHFCLNISHQDLKIFKAPCFWTICRLFLAHLGTLYHILKNQLPETFRTEWFPIVAVRL